MSIVSAPFKPDTFSAIAKTEQELAYELLDERSWTEEAFLTFSEAFNRPLELSDGKLVVLPMPLLLHQRVLKRFVRHADEWLTAGARGEVLFASHPIRLRTGKLREPDAMIWLNEHKDRMQGRASGPPDLALEIISPGNEQHDLVTKLREYAQAGVPEYWIIEPEIRRVSVFSLENGAYKLTSNFGVGEQARSVVLEGFAVPVGDLFQES